MSMVTDSPQPTNEGFDAGSGSGETSEGGKSLLGDLAKEYAGSGVNFGGGLAFGMGGVDLPEGSNLSVDPGVLLGGAPDPAWHPPMLPGAVPEREQWHAPMLAPDDDPAGPWSQ